MTSTIAVTHESPRRWRVCGLRFASLARAAIDQPEVSRGLVPSGR